MRIREKHVDLGAFAFFQGAQGVPLAETLHEIRATHNEKRAKLQEQSTRTQKPFEATIQTLQQLRPTVDAAWNEMLRRYGVHAPPIVLAGLIAILGMVALVVDAILLGPALDGVGLSDPVLQLVAGFALAALSSAIFHFAHESFAGNHLGVEIKIVWRIFGGLTVIALLVWGVFRGFEVQFSATVSHNPLGSFLGSHPVLSSIFFSFISLATPLAGAAALHYAAPILQGALAWKRARTDYERLHSRLGDTTKNLEAEKATLQNRIEQLNAQQENWAAVASQHHERGRLRGARQTPHWLVLLKAFIGSLAGLVLGCALGAFFAPLYFALPVLAGVGAFLFYRNRRFHPGYSEFRKLENTLFAVGSERFQPPQKSAPMLLPPTEDRQ